MSTKHDAPPPPDANALVPAAPEDEVLCFPLPAELEEVLPPVGNSSAGKGQVDQWARSFHETLDTWRRSRAAFQAMRASFESGEGVLAHTAGTYLLQLRGHQAWKALGLEGAQELWNFLGIAERSAQRLMFFARVATETTAPSGVRKCIAGWRLARALKAGGLGDLVGSGPLWREPEQWAKKLGEPVDFARSGAERLERLVARLKALPAAVDGPVRGVVERRTAVIDGVAGRKPVLASLGPRSYATRGRALVKHRRPSTREEFAALSAMYAALARE